MSLVTLTIKSIPVVSLRSFSLIFGKASKIPWFVISKLLPSKATGLIFLVSSNSKSSLTFNKIFKVLTFNDKVFFFYLFNNTFNFEIIVI